MAFTTTNPRYDEAAATLSWTRTIDFFTKQIVDYGIRNFALLDDIAALMMTLW
jgi:hypothetical protein